MWLQELRESEIASKRERAREGIAVKIGNYFCVAMGPIKIVYWNVKQCEKKPKKKVERRETKWNETKRKKFTAKRISNCPANSKRCICTVATENLIKKCRLSLSVDLPYTTWPSLSLTLSLPPPLSLDPPDSLCLLAFALHLNCQCNAGAIILMLCKLCWNSVKQ